MFFVCLFVCLFVFKIAVKFAQFQQPGSLNTKKITLKVSDNEIIYGDKQRTLLTAEVG